ncbi:MAG: hypothetical protein NUV57_00285, partial [archaeon]|nr:hypothetical protein [archaeon]
IIDELKNPTSGIKVVDNLAPVLDSQSAITGYTHSISKEAQEKAYKEIEDRLIGKVRDSALGKNTAFAKLVENGFTQRSSSALAEAAKAKVNPDQAIPKFFGKGGLLYIKNIVKEGLFGLFANYLGLKAYDLALENELAKTPQKPDTQTVSAELSKRGVIASDLSPLIFESEDKSNEIIKYNTYRIKAVTETGGDTKLIIKLTNNIPKDTAEEFILNDCKDTGFDKELDEAFPGLIPKVENVENYPEPFKPVRMQQTHLDISNNYLSKQPNGDRYATLIAGAVNADNEKTRQQFEKTTGMNLEALVTSIGIVKTGLGLSEQLGDNFMFGCDVEDATKKAVSNNATCAVNKLLEYTDCQKEAECYLNKYNDDSKNLGANFNNFSPADFANIYKAWASYAIDISS